MNKVLNILISRMGTHVSSVVLIALYALMYLGDDHVWIDQYLPENGKPLMLFMVVAVVLLYELSAFRFSQVDAKLCKLSDQIAIANLKTAVNALYNRFVQSDDEFITNEYTIKELSELKDLREKYKVNSYTQERLQFMCSKVRRK